MSETQAKAWTPVFCDSLRIAMQDVRGRVNTTSFAPAAAWKRLSFSLQIFAVGENLE